MPRRRVARRADHGGRRTGATTAPARALHGPAGASRPRRRSSGRLRRWLGGACRLGTPSVRVSHRPGGGGFRLGLRLALAVKVRFGFGAPQAAVSGPEYGCEPGGLVAGRGLNVSSSLTDPGDGGVLV